MNIPADANVGQSPRHSSRDSWNFFDAIYCISVRGRADRRSRAEQEFARAGLTGLVEFIIVEKHPTDAEEGIFNSHLQCLRAGLARGDNILIFEDDVIFHHFSEQALKNAIAFLKAGTGWEMFCFGCFVKSSRSTRYPSIIQVKYRCLAHAYAVKRAFAQRLLGTPWTGMAYDDVLQTSIGPGRAYALYPAFAFQSGAPTDNNKTPLIDRIRRLLGGLRRLQRWNEFSNRHMRALIVAHVIAAIILIATALWLHLRMVK